MEKIRLRLGAAGIGIKIKYNFDCNPFVRVDKRSKSNTRNGFETVVNDILFAEDSVFYGYAKEVKMMFLIHISEPTRQAEISYGDFSLK